LVINQFETTAKDINSFVPKTQYLTRFSYLLPSICKGVLGSIKDYTDLVLGSSYGGAKIKGQFNQQVKNKEKYNAVASEF
jgi:hypothetical protein